MRGDLTFEHPDWSLLPEPPALAGCVCGWTNNQGMVISLHQLGLDRALRNRMPDPKAVRDHYRAGFARQGTGLIECDVLLLQGLQAARAIAKRLTPPHGAGYIGTIALPLPNESYVFNVAAREGGITGVRETAVMLKISTELEKQGYTLDLPNEAQPKPATPIAWKNATTGAVIRWAEDPYDPGFNGPCMRNLADAPEHDAGLPEHPLSLVRAALKCLTEGLTLSDALKQRAAKKNRWLPW